MLAGTTRRSSSARSPATGRSAVPTLARATHLTRAATSELIAELLAAGLVEELGTRAERGVGKPATMLGLVPDARLSIAVDLSDDIDDAGGTRRPHRQDRSPRAIARPGRRRRPGRGRHRRSTSAASSAPRPTGHCSVSASGAPVWSMPRRRIVEAPNLGWESVDLSTSGRRCGRRPGARGQRRQRRGVGRVGTRRTRRSGACSSSRSVKVSVPVWCSTAISCSAMGSPPARSAMSWSIRRARYAPAAARDAWRPRSPPPTFGGARSTDGFDAALSNAGQRLGEALAPVIGALNLREIVLSGPPDVLDERFRSAAWRRSASAHSRRSATTSISASAHSGRTTSYSVPQCSFSTESWASHEHGQPRAGTPPAIQGHRQHDDRTRSPFHLGEDNVRISKLVAVGLAGALFVAACGDDDDASSDATGDAGTATTGDAARRPAASVTTTGEGTQPPATTTGGSAAHHRRRPEVRAETLRVWLNGPDTPDAVLDVAKAEFAKAHPDVTVEVERQEWDGLVDRLATVLPTDDSPDIFEVGNTQAQAFEAAGAMVDLTDAKEEMGGDDLARQPRRVGHVRRAVLRRPAVRRCSHRRLPQGPVREVEPRDPDDDGGVRRRRQEAAGGQRRRAQLLRHLLPRPQLAGDAVVHLGRRRRHRRQGRRRMGRRARLARVGRRPRRRCRTSWSTPTRRLPTPTTATTTSTSATARSGC